jgi:hypothetical protein
MSAIQKVLVKSVVIPFYRSHTGLLLFVFLIMFGTVESKQLVNYHRTLIEAMFETPVFMVSVFLIWTLYSLKILLFNLALLKKPDYSFVTHLMLPERFISYGQILLITVTCHLPVLVYSIFIYMFGVSKGYYALTAVIFLFQCLLCFFCTYVQLFFIRTQHRFTWTVVHVRVPNAGGRIGFYVSHLLAEEKIAVLINKIFSLGLLYIVREAIEPGDDFRILGLTWVFVVLSHTFLIRKVQMFEDRYLRWAKNLPFTAFKTCTMYTVLYAGLLIPELILASSMVENPLHWVMLVVLTSGMLTFIYGYLLRSDRDPEKFGTFIFWLLIGSFFAVLCKLIFPLGLVLLIFAWVRIVKRYYRYEPTIE